MSSRNSKLDTALASGDSDDYSKILITAPDKPITVAEQDVFVRQLKAEAQSGRREPIMRSAMSELKLSAFADEYAAATKEQLQGLARFGIQYIEIRHLAGKNTATLPSEQVKQVKSRLDHFGGELRCVFDMDNFVLEGVEPLSAYELLQLYVAYFHVKDALASGTVVPPGVGDAKIKQILEAHKSYADTDFFVSLEPHLQTFSGLNVLVGRSFDNPDKYPDAKTAFSDAVAKFRALV